jgi:hypothetical protein
METHSSSSSCFVSTRMDWVALDLTTGKQRYTVPVITKGITYRPLQGGGMNMGEKSSVADPDRFGPDPTSENRPDPDPVKTRSGFI